MSAQTRTRKSAPQNRAKSFSDAANTIEPWHKLNKTETRAFNALIDSREVDTWLDADIEMATRLSKLMVYMDSLWAQCMEEGPTFYNEKGTLCENPIFRTHNTLTQNYKTLKAALGLSASQRGVAGNKQAKRNQQDAAAKKTVKGKPTSKIASLIKHG